MSKGADITTAYSEALVEIVEAHPRVVVLDADLPDSCQTEAVYRKHPTQAVDIGVAEQSLPTIAAGLALMGRIPLYNTFAVFATGRGFDMLRVSVAYTNANVKVVGHAAGLALGYAGPTHHALEDLALMRSLPGFVVLNPSDAVECRQMVRWMVVHDGPVYLRLSRAVVPDVHAEGWKFQCGAPEMLAEGKDVVLFSTGDVCTLALEARARLEQSGVNARVVNVSCLKPLDAEAVVSFAKNLRGAVAIEDHNIVGGLGSALAEILAEAGGPPLRRIGVRDRFTESDDCNVLRDYYGVSTAEICTAAETLAAGPAAASLSTSTSQLAR